jgi:hypothetical protein
MINYAAFEDLKRRILQEAELVNMGVYLDPLEGQDGEICGTIGCIAGHACMMEHGRNLKWERDAYNWSLPIPKVGGVRIDAEDAAQKILGLTYKQAMILFLQWPQYVEDETPGTRLYAKAVVRWIDEFLAAPDGPYPRSHRETEEDEYYGDDEDDE